MKSSIMEKVQSLVTEEIKRTVDYSMYIAARILDLLDNKGLTSLDLGIRFGLTEDEIASWLSGTYLFNINQIAELEIFLGENIFEFVKLNNSED